MGKRLKIVRNKARHCSPGDILYWSHQGEVVEVEFDGCVGDTQIRIWNPLVNFGARNATISVDQDTIEVERPDEYMSPAQLSRQKRIRVKR